MAIFFVYLGVEELKALFLQVRRFENEPCANLQGDDRKAFKRMCKLYQRLVGKKQIGCSVCGMKHTIKMVKQYLSGHGII